MTLSKKLKRYKGWIAVALIVAVAVTAVVLLRGARESTALTSYTTETVASGTLSVTVDGTGNLAVRDEVDAYPSVSGDVAKIYVSEGDTVEEGDVLYKLSATSVDQAVSSAKAAKQQASTSVSKAKLELYRAEASLDDLEEKSDEPSSTVSSSDVTVAKKEVSIAKQGVTSAQTSYSAAAEEYEDALDELDELEVTAPCDGVIWTINVEKGDSVSPEGGDSSSSSSGSAAGGTTTTSSSSSSGAPVTIARDGKMGVEMSVNEVDVTGLAAGQDAQVEFDAVTDLSMTGTVDEVASAGTVDSGVVTYSVWITLDGTDERLRTGMSATATVVTAVERGVLLVSNSAIKSADDGSSYVQVLEQGAQTPTDVTVVTGLSNATQTVIESGVAEGAAVVTKTTTTSADDSSDESDEEDSGSGQGSGMGGMMMMGGGTPPSGGPPSGGAPGGQ